MNSNTLVLTNKGWIPMLKLVGKKTQVWNGEDWSIVVPKKLYQDKKKCVNIELENGPLLTCYEYHKVYITETHQVRNQEPTETIKEVFVSNLKPKDKVISYKFPVVKDGNEQLESQEVGFRPIADGYAYAQQEGENFPFVPLSYNFKTRLKWITGFLDKGGRLGPHGISITNQHWRFKKYILHRAQLLLMSLGVNSIISRHVNSRFTGPTFKLHIPMDQVNLLIRLGAKFRTIPRQEIKFIENSNINTTTSYTIKSVTNCSQLQDIYGFTENEHNRAVFEGIMTSTTID